MSSQGRRLYPIPLLICTDGTEYTFWLFVLQEDSFRFQQHSSFDSYPCLYRL